MLPSKVVSNGTRYSNMLQKPPSKKLLSSGNRRVSSSVSAMTSSLLARQGGEKKSVINGIDVFIENTGKMFELEMESTNYKTPRTLRWINDASARDVPWNRVKSFLSHNKTFTEGSYELGEFTCGDFSAAIHNDAEVAGIKCGLAAIIYKDDYSHSLNVFNTADYGWVFVDGTIGGFFSKRNFFNQGNNFKSDAITNTYYDSPSGQANLKDFFYGHGGMDTVMIKW